MNSFLEGYLQPIATFVAHHSVLGSVLVFLLALSESLPVIGAVSPGTATILAISAMAGLGYIPVWMVLVAALLGAIAGDGLSYWFGRHYRARALGIWPMRRFPHLIASSEAFFTQHGAKSIAIARFTPVVRAFVPLIAGISGMPPTRFYFANIASAIVWAFSHIVPAAAAGASLAVIHQISGRLLAALVALVVTATLLTILMRRGLRWGSAALTLVQRSAHAAFERRQGRTAEIIRDLTRPNNAAAREVTWLGLILAIALALIFNLIEGVFAPGQLTRANQALTTLVGGWRTEWGDSVMVAITAFGDTPVTAFVALVADVWLYGMGDRRLYLGLIAAVAATMIFVIGLKATLPLFQLTALYRGADAFNLPGGHSAFAATLYGILGWICSRDLERPWKTFVVAGMATVVAAITSSRIYLQVYRPSDVATGLIFGFAITATFALAFRRDDMQRLKPLRLLAVAIVVLLTVGFWHAAATHAIGLKLYARRMTSFAMSEVEWRQTGWRELPAYRVDLVGEHEDPIILQWSGSVGSLRSALVAYGWQSAVSLDLATASAYLKSDTPPIGLPVLPSLNDGRPPVATFVRAGTTSNDRDILHVWSSTLVLGDRGDTPVLVVEIVRDHISHLLTFMTVPSRPEAAGVASTLELAGELPNARVEAGPTGPVILAGP